MCHVSHPPSTSPLFCIPQLHALASCFSLPALLVSLPAAPVLPGLLGAFPPSSPCSIPLHPMPRCPGTGKGRTGKGFHHTCALVRRKTIYSHSRAGSSREGGCYQPLQDTWQTRELPNMVAGAVLCRKVFQCLLETIRFRPPFEHLLGFHLVQGPVLARCTAHPLLSSPPSPPAQSCPSGPFPVRCHLSPLSHPAAVFAFSYPPTRRSVKRTIKPFLQRLH